MPNSRFKDRILPVQSEFSEQFGGSAETFYQTLFDTIMRFGGLRPFTEVYDLSESPQLSIEEMASSPMMMQFLQSLILIKQPQRVLEIGTFIGISALSMASVLPERGQVVTIEKYDHFACIARENFLRNKLYHKIQLIEGDAYKEIKKLKSTQPFDLIFLDGNKERYEDYFQVLDPLLAIHGVFVVDDVLFHGDVLNDVQKTEKGAGVKKFLERVEKDKRYHKTLLPIANGVMVMFKLFL